jgi:hypothetical protein
MNLKVTHIRGMRRVPNELILHEAQFAWIQHMHLGAKSAIAKHTPRGSGAMAEWLADGDGVSQITGGFASKMGSIGSLRIGRSAPRNTIKQFLNWYRGSRKRAVTSSRPFPVAWYILSGSEKDSLQNERSGGSFGGPQPPPTYMAAVNEGTVPLPVGSGASAKAQANKGFIDRTQAEVASKRQGALAAARRVVT